MKKNFIVVTGGAGFIGSNLIEHLLNETKYHIISLDNYSSGNKANHIKNKRVIYKKGHSKNFNKIFNKIKNKIKVVFHFGEFSRIAQSFSDTYNVFQSNIYGSFEVINFCLKNNIKIIYSATSASLGNEMQDQHLSPYAFTKTKNLQLILNFHKWYDLKYEIIYFFNVYGPREIINHKMAAVIGIFRYFKKKNMPLPIVKPGTQKRNFTHVHDTVKGCIYAMKLNKNRQYSVSSNKAYSINQVAKYFNHKTKLVPYRKGERFKSSLPKKIHGQKIINLQSNSDLKKYIDQFNV
jgi:UDP-glucose 4-epimerase